MQCLNSIGICLLGLALVACTPSYTVEKTQLYARKIGFTNQYEVSRWHSRRIPPSSKLLVVMTSDTGLIAAHLNAAHLNAAHVVHAVANPLSAHFANVDMLPNLTPVAAARKEGTRKQSQFLVAINQFESSKSILSMSSDEGENEDNAMNSESADPEPTNLDGLRIEIALIDVLSGITVDKFLLVGSTSYFNFTGSNVERLLYPPLEQLAQDLAAH